MYEIRWLIKLFILLQSSLITPALLILNECLVNQPIFYDGVVWSWWSPRVIGRAFRHLIRQTKLHLHAPQVISYSHDYFCSLTGRYVFIYIHQKLDGFSICFSFFFNINLFILIGGFLFFSYPVRRLTRPPRVRLGVIRGLSGDTGAQHWYQHCCHWVDFVKHSNLIYIFNVQLIDHLILFLPVFLSLG